jgi:tetratricopeptide (TPR) repeat protein
VLARRGALGEAEQLVREAVRIYNQTGETDHEGDTYFDLAEVLELAGRPADAAEALREALARWERKGNQVSAAKAQAKLAELGAA